MSGAGDSLISDDEEDGGSTVKLEEGPRKIAHTYAWEYFKYHAQQRQAAFRFFLVVVAALIAALIPKDSSAPTRLVGAALMFASLLFWRLDKRNSLLVKLAEKYLKEEER